MFHPRPISPLTVALLYLIVVLVASCGDLRDLEALHYEREALDKLFP